LIGIQSASIKKYITSITTRSTQVPAEVKFKPILTEIIGTQIAGYPEQQHPAGSQVQLGDQ
jgi:hypothetical protein